MARPSYFANYIPKLLQAGHTPTEAMRILRDSGHSFADATFRRVWGETQDHLSKIDTVVHAPLNRVPTPDQIGTATRPKARGYLYNVEVAVHDPNTGEVSFHAWGVRSQKPISIGAALRRAVQTWGDVADLQTTYDMGRPLGGFVSSVLNLVGPEDDISYE